MGFALANVAALRGAEVTLVAGPVQLETPRNVKRINVESADQMQKAVSAEAKKADAVVMAAAVADFTPQVPARTKIKKDSKNKNLDLHLTATPDILASLGGKKNGTVLVGFALETDNELAHAKEKLKKKNLDMIVLNSLADEGAGFGVDTNIVTIIERNGHIEKLKKMTKFDVANEILNRVKNLL